MKILLPIQFDNLSDHAFLQVYKLCLDVHAELLVLATYEPVTAITPTGESASEAWDKKLTNYTNEELKKFTNLYPHAHPVSPKHVPIRHLVREKPFWRAISDIQEEEKVDFVAWPYRNFMPIIEFFFPTPDITGLLEHLTSNLLIMPAKQELEGVRKLVYATSFKKEELDRMDLLFKWKEEMSIESLELVKVIKPNEEKKHAYPSPIKMMELKRGGVDEFVILQNRSITKALKEYIGTDRDTILTIHLPPASLVNRLTHFHLSRDILHHSDLPIILQVN